MIRILVLLPWYIFASLFTDVNLWREEDFFTWLLDLKELGIYDGAVSPYTNQFEIPEAREQYLRHFDTGAVYGQVRNPAFKNIAD